MEAARRELAQGHQGRLLCFNRLLGRRLTADMPEDSGLKVGNLHRQLLAVTGVKPPADPPAEFWTEELPERAMESIVAMGDDAAVDFLVIDEVQDILSEPYLDVLDLMVKGGLRSGRVLLFGDFERQAIYDDGAGRELLRARMPRLPSCRLTMNCRNLPRIGHSVNMFSGLEPGYRKFRRGDDGMNPGWLKYEAGSDQTPLLLEAIQRLRDDHYQLHEISCSAHWRKGQSRRPRPISGSGRSCNRRPARRRERAKCSTPPSRRSRDLRRRRWWSRISTEQLVPNFESVLYVGLTRATDRLYGVIEADTLRAVMEGER